MATVMKAIIGLADTQYRPCVVITPHRNSAPTERKALFHKWTLEQSVVPPGCGIGSHPGGQLSSTLALVELEDGLMATVRPEHIMFLDTDGMMGQISFGRLDDEKAEDDE